MQNREFCEALLAGPIGVQDGHGFGIASPWRWEPALRAIEPENGFPTWAAGVVRCDSPGHP